MPSSSIMAACRKARKAVSQMTPSQRRALQKRAMRLINDSPRMRVTFVLDRVLSTQLKALGCTFNTTYDGRTCPRLHVGPPDTFWTTATRILSLVKTVYPRAEMAMTDVEDCVSIELEGVT